MRGEPSDRAWLNGLIGRARLPFERGPDSPVTDTASHGARGRAGLVAAWCDRLGGDEALLARRLAWDGLSIAQGLSRCCNADVATVQDVPAWAQALARTLEQLERQQNSSCNGGASAAGSDVPFIDALQPLVDIARTRLEETLARRGIAVSRAAVDDLCVELLHDMSSWLAPSLLTEFIASGAARSSVHLFRSRRRYDAFVATVLGDRFRRFFERYPLLGRFTGTLVSQWHDNAVLLFERLQRDARELERLTAGDTEQIAAIETGLSDRHGGGATVLRIRFANGAAVIYKPRPVMLEADFQQLLAWLNKQGWTGACPLRPVQILDRDDYGWCEDIAAAPLSSRAGAARYFRRAGMLLALTQLFGTTDLHHENLIACGEQPILVDLETLLHPRRRPAHDARQRQAHGLLVERMLLDSVISTGLLPRWRFDASGAAFDDTGLGGIDEADLGATRYEWRHVNSDQMSMRQRPRRQKRRGNCVLLDGELERPEDYAEALCAGFEAMHGQISERRDRFLRAAPVARMAKSRGRYLYRDSNVYALLLSRLRHPTVAADAVEAELVLEQLARGELAARDERPAIWPLVEAEKRQLLDLDLPRFTVNGDGDISAADGTRVSDVFDHHPWQQFLRRLANAGDEERAFQVSLIGSSLAARRPVADAAGTKPGRSAQGASPSDIALGIGQAILDTAVQAPDGSLSWITVGYDESGIWQPQVIGPGLYDGAAGVMLCLAALFAVTGNAAQGEAARRLADELLARCDDADIPKYHGASLAYGTAGVIYALERTALLLGDASLADACPRLARHLAVEQMYEASQLDLLSGIAGVVTVLAAQRRDRSTQTPVAEQTMRQAGSLLLQRLGAAGDGAAQLPPGLAHGLAGVSLALARLAKCTGEARYLQAAHAIAVRENDSFDPELGNWCPSVAQSDQPQRPALSRWCWGAPGIALSRVASGDPTLAGAWDRAATLHHLKTLPPSGVDHVCCGNLGRLEIMAELGRRLENRGLCREAHRRLIAKLDDAASPGDFQLGWGEGLLMPGFFQGLAGIGYALLRLENPDALPCVLAFE